MNAVMQNLVVAAVVIAAAIFLGVRWHRTFDTKRKGACGCDAGKAGCAKIAEMNRSIERAGRR